MRDDRGKTSPRGRFVPTLNETGYMIDHLDEVSRAFVEFAAGEAPAPAVDIGAAYGVATRALLDRGALVTAIDIAQEHLDLLVQRTPETQRSRLTVVCGDFPDGVALPAGSVGAALLARVLHFFDGPTVERAVRKLFDWLAPGGRAFVVVEASIFLEIPKLRDLYESRRAAGELWPGYVDHVRELLPKRGRFLPERIHYLDPETLSGCFRKTGFRLLRAGPFSRLEDPDDPDSPVRESVGLIACRD